MPAYLTSRTPSIPTVCTQSLGREAAFLSEAVVSLTPETAFTI
jgi:hypothetical protein